MKPIYAKMIGAVLAIGSFAPVHADNIILTAPADYQVLAISPNGKWACGAYQDYMMTPYPFRWNLVSGSIEMLSKYEGVAYGVANDGTVSGEFSDFEADASGVAVTRPGFYRDGKWHHVEAPGGTRDGFGRGISANGEYFTGALHVNGACYPAIWKGTELLRLLDITTNEGVAFHVTNDGKAVTGYDIDYNRTVTIWDENGHGTHITDLPGKESKGPWSYGRKFSSDGRYLVYWGGWETDEETNSQYLYCYMDMLTGERFKVKTLVPLGSGSVLEFFDINVNGTMSGSDVGRGVVYMGDEGRFIDDYLAYRNIDIADWDGFYRGEDGYIGILPINNVVGISDDENVIVMQYYNTDGLVSSMALITGVDASLLPPCEIKARKLEGLNSVELTWKNPAGGDNILGYNVYRDGQRLNGFMPVNRLFFYDKAVEQGLHSYEVATVNADGVETRAEAVTIDVAGDPLEAPTSTFARRKGSSNALISWNAPMSTLTHKRYYNPESTTFEPMHIYRPVHLEAAVRWDKDEMANYDGYTVREVSFVPMGNNEYPAVNFYTYTDRGHLQQLGSQPITQELTLNVPNTIVLDTPLVVPEGDLIVAVEVNVTNPEGDKLIDTEYGPFKPRYSDLMRQVEELDYFSCYLSSLSTGMSLTFFSWAIDVALAPANAENTVGLDHYAVYLNDEKVGETNDNELVVERLTDGTYTVTAEAVYTNGEVVAAAPYEFNMRGAFPAVENVKLEKGYDKISAQWDAPMELDTKVVTYSNDEVNAAGIAGNESSNYAYMAGVLFPKEMVRGYSNYRIANFRFYPLCDAIYTFMLYENNKPVYELEVKDFTVNEWNECALPDDILVDGNAEYFLVLDIFDPMPEEKALGLGSGLTHEGAGDLFSTDGGATWESLSEYTSLEGNWMLGMTIAEMTEAVPMEVTGYEVVLDGAAVGDGLLSDTAFEYQFPKHDSKLHALRIDTYYPMHDGAVYGTAHNFYMAINALDATTVAEISLLEGANYLIAQGDGVQSIELYTVAGAKAGATKGNRLDITDLRPGMYVATVNAAGAVKTFKVRITRNK